MNEHHVIVTSNVKDPRNRSGHFHNTLSTPIYLEGEWKVGVRKILYLNNFLNIIDEKYTTHRFVNDAFVFIPINDATISAVNGPNIKCRTRVTKLSTQDSPTPPPTLPPRKKSTPPDEEEESGILVSDEEDDTDIETHLDVLFNDDASKPKFSFALTTIHIKRDDKFTKIKSDIIYNDEHKAPHTYRKYLGEGTIQEIKLEIKYTTASTHVIPQGNYDTVDELVKAIPKAHGVTFKVGGGGFVEIEVDSKKLARVELQNYLNMTLGFKSNNIIRTARADYLPQLNRGRFAFFLYSNLVGLCHVGDVEVPLLDVVGIPRNPRVDVVSLDVINPLYRPVIVKRVEDIEIKIATDSGEVVAFDNTGGDAKTLILLHFVKV